MRWMRAPDFVVAVCLVAALSSSYDVSFGQEARDELGHERRGIAFRVVWFETAEPGTAGVIDEFRFPMATDYPSQVIRAVVPIGRGVEEGRDRDGNRFISLARSVVVEPERPTLMGFTADVSTFAPSHRVLQARRPSWSRRIPEEVRARFLVDSPDYGIGEQGVREVVAGLEVGSPTPDELMRRIWSFVHDGMTYDTTPRPNSGAELLSWKRGLCGEFSRLAVTLARACRLPAREVHSFAMSRSGPVSNDHAWAEVHLPGAGWIPVQPQEPVPPRRRYPLDYFRYLVVFRGADFASKHRVSRHQRVIQHGASGVGFLAEGQAADFDGTAALLQQIARDDGTHARALYRRVPRSGSTRAVLLWALAASKSSRVGARASRDLVKLCADSRSLDLDEFIESSPTLVRHRLARARGIADVPAEAREFGSHLYFAFDDRMTWEEARKYCRRLGGHLVAITTPEEQAFVQALPRRLEKGHRFWIGLRRRSEAGDWAWTTGEPVEYSNWARGHPDRSRRTWNPLLQARLRGGRPNHGALGFSPHRWVDGDGRALLKGFVCEWDAPPEHGGR